MGSFVLPWIDVTIFKEERVVHEVETRDVLEVLEPRVERELTEVSLAVNDVVESAQRRARAG